MVLTEKRIRVAKQISIHTNAQSLANGSYITHAERISACRLHLTTYKSIIIQSMNMITIYSIIEKYAHYIVANNTVEFRLWSYTGCMTQLYSTVLWYSPIFMHVSAHMTVY